MRSPSDLSERPDFEPDEPRVWPLGGKTVRGRLLTSFSTDGLLCMRRELGQKNHGGAWDYLIAQIDEVLGERGGE